MTENELHLFEELTKDRKDSARVLNKTSLQGVKNTVVDKYSDQAHFIYELLQNADDTGATSAEFSLQEDCLIFKHNGTKHFTITNPDSDAEANDAQNGTLGDINAITAVANSNKTEASIGKFGVGFKAVFQYTSTPHIYDPHFCFKIDGFIVPILLNTDHPQRKPEETLFEFPFDHEEVAPDEAYKDISNKLQNLTYPILFLSHLKKITYQIGDFSGDYEKDIIEQRTINNTTIDYICLKKNNEAGISSDYLWLFSRTDASHYRYCVGYFADEEGRLRSVNETAFCFFPTKETTGLNFIIHAPFLLNDSRENIRAGNPHNERMIDLLSDLAADALLYLRDIGISRNNRIIDSKIFDIVPVDPSKFTPPDNKDKLSFLPFYTSILKKFTHEEILPASDGYVSKQNAYMANVRKLTELFDDNILKAITGNNNAKWLLLEYGHDELHGNEALIRYIKGCINLSIDENIILRNGWFNPIRGVDASFIEEQPMRWLSKFYKWLGDTEGRTEIAKKHPFFLNQDKKAVAAYDNKNHLILFLPEKDMSGYTTVHPDLLADENARALIDKIGVVSPALEDRIYNVILPLYKHNVIENVDTAQRDNHFRIFYKYYEECPNNKAAEYLKLIKDCSFIRFVSLDRRTYGYAKADELYFPSELLEKYFELSSDTKFVELDVYKDAFGDTGYESLLKFLRALGIHFVPKILIRDISSSEAVDRKLPDKHSSHMNAKSWKEPYIDGCKQMLQYISDFQDSVKSAILWEVLCEIAFQTTNFTDRITGWHYYYFRKNLKTAFEASSVRELKSSKWLIDKSGEFHAPTDLYQDNINDIYDIEIDGADKLIELLNIQDAPAESISENLSETQKKQIEFARKCEELGIKNAEDLEEYAEWRKQKQETLEESLNTDPLLHNNENAESIVEFGKQFIQNSNDNEDDTDENTSETISSKRKRLDRTKSDVVGDILELVHPKTSADKNREESNDDNSDDFQDFDDYTPRQIDYSKQIERAKEKSAAEIDRIAYYEELQQKATDSKRYSFEWFNTLLEMEALNGAESNNRSREVSISFAHVELEEGTKRTLILKHPNRYIPQYMEDLADIPLVLKMGDESRTLAIEVANVMSYTLRVKLKSDVDAEGIDFNSVTEARIDSKNPVFLIQSLKEAFKELKLSSDYDMQMNLCENIRFIFGPPGTGKTTYLSREILYPFMQEKRKLKVLVLTPTNKAADVLTNRLIEIMGDDHSYEDWLIRFGTTNDETLEQSIVFRDKSFDIRTLDRNVTVTTIARFPYDFFMPGDVRLYLQALKWDYIVIDEASMIPLANIIYPLYKKSPEKFIIAGDPFQIEPITSVDLWKGENIYTMVHLDSFVNPQTVPHKYKVDMLMTQYRSVPAIGDVFSKFAYGGALNHYRHAETQRRLNIDDVLMIDTLNIIKFPVSRFESIYRSKRLQQSSSYQIYSALFTYEFVEYLSKLIVERNPGEVFHIGVIAPYRAQADLLDKLLASADIPKAVDVQVGTIHGFQGDECDIIFAVFNAPPVISSSDNMFLNKRNIVNVSISRARDYLFIVMPDDNTEKINNLRLIKRVERYLNESGYCREFEAHYLESLMFGNSFYLEENTFSTSHQSVNVYGVPEKKYEVRSEDTAVDIQIHKRNVGFKADLQEKHDKDDNMTTYFYSEIKKTYCPFDNDHLEINRIQIEAKNGDKARINVMKCPECGRTYISRSFVPANTTIEDYKITVSRMD